jgi:acetyltransferase-like isoleucine patch superfamily enzyme
MKMHLLTIIVKTILRPIIHPRYFWWLHATRPQVLRSFGCIGEGVEFDHSVIFSTPSRIKLGNHVYIGPMSQLIGRGGIQINDHVIFGPEVLVMSSMHNWKNGNMLPYDQVEWLRPVRIERCVWIGMRAIIMPGVSIGEGSIIAAGAVLTKSCAPGAIMGGNPARQIGQRNMEKYKLHSDNERFYLKLKQQLGFDKDEVLDVSYDNLEE